MSFLSWERIKELDSTGISEKISRNELRKFKIEAQKEAEFRTLCYFLKEYERITGKEFVEIISSEKPDFLCRRELSPKIVGVELTQIQRGHPETIAYDSIIHKREYMKIEDALAITQECVETKEQKRQKNDWKHPNSSILVIEFNDIPLEQIHHLLNRKNLPDVYDTEFSEIWIVDLTGIEAYRNVELFCLIPACYEGYYSRSPQKPYG